MNDVSAWRIINCRMSKYYETLSTLSRTSKKKNKMSPCLIGDVAEPEEGPVAGWFFTPRRMMLYPARMICTCSISLVGRVFCTLGFVYWAYFCFVLGKV